VARPALEVSDILRDHGPAWREANRGHASLDQLKVMSAIERCRTAALGGHVARCENAACGHTLIAYNSCLMGRSSNGELAYWRQRFSVNCGNLSLHNSTVLRLRRLGHQWPVTNGDEYVGDLLLGIEDTGAFAEGAERTIR
jgi:hypothetical protein